MANNYRDKQNLAYKYAIGFVYMFDYYQSIKYNNLLVEMITFAKDCVFNMEMNLGPRNLIKIYNSVWYTETDLLRNEFKNKQDHAYEFCEFLKTCYKMWFPDIYRDSGDMFLSKTIQFLTSCIESPDRIPKVEESA